jgi:hypothetical protein
VRQRAIDAPREVPAGLWNANDRGCARDLGDRGDKLDRHAAFPGCFKKEQNPNLPLLDIGDAGGDLEHPCWRAKDE